MILCCCYPVYIHILRWTDPPSETESKVLPRRGHEHPQEEKRYSSTLFFNLGARWSGCLTPPLYPRVETRCPLYRKLGEPQNPSGRVRKTSSPIGIRSLNRQSRSESLYRLSYHRPPPIKRYLVVWKLDMNYNRPESVMHEEGSFKCFKLLKLMEPIRYTITVSSLLCNSLSLNVLSNIVYYRTENSPLVVHRRLLLLRREALVRNEN